MSVLLALSPATGLLRLPRLTTPGLVSPKLAAPRTAMLVDTATLDTATPSPATPGTTALASPPGFEVCYDTLRELRSSGGHTLVDIRHLDSLAPEVAARLRERVNFDVPATRRQAISTFFAHPTARFISGALVLALAVRARLGPPTPADALAVVATATFWAFQEWAIHDKLLHSAHSWFGETVHRWHHELPYYHVSLDGLGLAAVWFSVVATLLVAFGALTATMPACVSALASYTLCGGLYEAAHYLAHTRVPLPPALRAIRRHHCRHHTVSDSYWLAFTVPAIDTLLGTNPRPQDVTRAAKAAAKERAAAAATATAPGLVDGVVQPTRRRRPARMLASVAQEEDAAPPADDGGIDGPGDGGDGGGGGGGGGGPRGLRDELPALLRMARPNTIPMGAGLVGLGGYGARRAAGTAGAAAATTAGAAAHAPGPVAARLLLSVLLTVIVTSGSMLINDFYDHRDGVDTPLTKPGRPLVTGEVRPASVKLVLKWAYAAHLTLLCLVDSALVRLWILANTLLTYLYSVHLKPLTGVKNAVCAAIVAMAIGLGALAVGDAGAASLGAVWRPVAAAFGLIFHREMVMDIKDREGDTLAGVRTVAVAFGARRALLLSLLPLAAAAAAAATAPGTRAAAVACGSLLVQGAFALVALARGFSPSSLGTAIELAPVWLLSSLVALTV